MSKKEKTNYELMFIFAPELTDKETDEKMTEIKKQIQSAGGEITIEDVWGLRDLSYRIKKRDQGFYYVVNFTLAGKDLLEIEKELNIDKDILRFLVTKTPNQYQYKTGAQYEKEREEMEKEREAEREENEKNSPVKAKAPKPKKVEKKEEKPEPKKETKEKKEEKVEKKEEKPEVKSEEKLKEVENKLKDILEDPDLMDI